MERSQEGSTKFLWLGHASSSLQLQIKKKRRMENTGDSSQPNMGDMDFEMWENNISLMTLDGHKSAKILYLGKNE